MTTQPNITSQSRMLFLSLLENTQSLTESILQLEMMLQYEPKNKVIKTATKQAWAQFTANTLKN
jgi:hypothetical protein